jgi:hypothetical protein
MLHLHGPVIVFGQGEPWRVADSVELAYVDVGALRAVLAATRGL